MSERINPSEWIGSWLARRVEKSPAGEAIRLRDRTISYSELGQEVEFVSRALRDHGVGPGDVVAVLLDNGAEWGVVLWSLQSIGACLLPLNLRWRPRELAHVLRDSGARWLLHGPAERAVQAAEVAEDWLAGARLELQGVRLERKDSPARVIPPSAASRSDDLEGILAIVYTSGTTGSPKGVLLPAEAFLASAAASAEMLGAIASDRWLVCMPLFHVGGLSILVRCCLSGSCAVIHRDFDPARVAESFAADEVSGVSWVATMLERVLAEREGLPAPPGLRFALVGGGPVSEALLRRAHDLGYPVAPTYGLTESASQVATCPPDGVAQSLKFGLRPLSGVQLRVVDDLGHELAANQVGEICVRGPTLMRGYLGLPDQTSRALRDGWLHTGDAGLLDEEGSLRVLERRDDLIVFGGENIYPAEIEGVLESHPAIREAGVTAEPHPEFGARPVAWCVRREAVRVSVAELRSFCRNQLAAYKVPDRFEWVDALPRSESGKLLRRKLRTEA